MTKPSPTNESDWDTPGIRATVLVLGIMQAAFLI